MTVATFQGCALAEPGGPWRLTFVLGRLENFSFFIEIICWAPWISQVQSTGLPSILVRAQPCIWNIIDTSTILSTQGWINSIATSHSKMGSVFKVWTKPRWKRRQRGWNWHTFQPTSLSIFTANNGHNNYLKNWYKSCYNKIPSNKNKPQIFLTGELSFEWSNLAG